jgi:septum formation protein
VIELILASASPRRLQLLEQCGFKPRVQVVDLLEQRSPTETPRQYCQRIAAEKAHAVARTLSADALVLAADTEVVLDEVVFGKPNDAEDAMAMLARLSGRTHEVITAITVMQGDRVESLLQYSAVKFKPLSAREVQDYVASGECFGKAGAYAIQGYGGCFIELLQGSYTGVMGLPVYECTELLNRFGCFARWQTPVEVLADS